MHKLLAYQLRQVTRADGSVDCEALIDAVRRTYEEFDRERRLNDRAARLMEEELKAANERVRQHAEQRLTETLEGAPSAIVLLSPEWKVENSNPAVAALCAELAMPPKQGEAFVDFLSRLNLDAEEEIRKLYHGETTEFEFAGRWYFGAAKQLSDGSHTVVFSDVSALKQREEALAMARDAAESANRLKSQFLATMSHELRTPLNAVLGFSEIIRDRVMGVHDKAWTNYSNYAASIHDSGRHLLSLISEILDLSKIESGSYVLQPETFDLGALVRNSLTLLGPQAEVGGVKLLPVEATGDLSVKADQRAIKQIVVNLLSNAVKFTPEGGKVGICIEAAPEEIVLRVRDTGIGIAQEYLETVFEAFHQGDAKVSRRYEGTGLGLSISRGLMEMHGGTITLESKVGAGTLAIVRLPRCVSDAHSRKVA